MACCALTEASVLAARCKCRLVFLFFSAVMRFVCLGHAMLSRHFVTSAQPTASNLHLPNQHLSASPLRPPLCLTHADAGSLGLAPDGLASQGHVGGEFQGRSR